MFKSNTNLWEDIHYRIINMKENKAVTLELIKDTGSKLPPIGADWLSEKEKGSVFLVQQRNKPDYILGLFQLMDKTEKACVLMTPDHPKPIYVSPGRFCQVYSEFEDLGILREKKDESNEDTMQLSDTEERN